MLFAEKRNEEKNYFYLIILQILFNSIKISRYLCPQLQLFGILIILLLNLEIALLRLCSSESFRNHLPFCYFLFLFRIGFDVGIENSFHIFVCQFRSTFHKLCINIGISTFRITRENFILIILETVNDQICCVYVANLFFKLSYLRCFFRSAILN